MKIEEGVELSRFTTLGTGGPARAFARPETVDELEEALAWARERELPVATVGLGSNLLVADDGRRRRSCSSSAASSPRREVDGERLRRGRRRGQRGLPAPRARGRARRLRVRVRDPRHDRRRRLDERRRVRQRLARRSSSARSSSTRDGARWLTPDELGLCYRHSELRHGQVVARAEFRLAPRPPEADQGERRRAAGAAEGDAADEQAHVRQRLQEPGARARARGGCSRRAGSKGHRIGGAQISPRHANFIENADGATHRRRARADGRGAAAGARAVRRRARARGRVPRPARAAAAAVGAARAAAKCRAVASALAGVRRLRAAVVALPRARAAADLRLLPSGRSLARRLRDRARRGRRSTCSRARRRCSPCDDRGRGRAAAPSPPRCARRSRRSRARACSRWTAARSSGALAKLPDVAAPATTATSRTRCA